MKSNRSRILFRGSVCGLLIVSMTLAFGGCSDQNAGNDTSSDSPLSSLYEESVDQQSELSNEPSLITDDSNDSDVSKKSDVSDDEPESEIIISSMESDEEEDSSEVSSEISEDVSEIDESSPEESVEESSETVEDEPVSTIYDDVPSDVTELIEQYTGDDGVLDLEAMLTEGLGLGGAQMGLYGDNYSISFCYDTIENTEAPGSIFIYSRDGQSRYVRNADASGVIPGVFRNYTLNLNARDVMEIYYVFVIDDVTGFKKI